MQIFFNTNRILRWLLLTFRCSKYFFEAEHGIYCWQSHQILKTRVKPQKQPLKLFCKKGVLRKFANFPGRHLCWSLFLIELQTFRPANFIEKRLQHRWFPVEFTKCLRTSNLKSANDCFSNLFFHQDCPFNKLRFRLKLRHIYFSLRFL